MKKILKLGTAVVACLMVAAIGIWAVLNTANLSIGSRVFFRASEGVYVRISGLVEGGSGGLSRTYEGSTYVVEYYDNGERVELGGENTGFGKEYYVVSEDGAAVPVMNAETWTIGDIEFTASGTIVYTLTFTNDSSEDKAEIEVVPTLAFVGTRVVLSGGLVKVDGDTGVATAEDGTHTVSLDTANPTEIFKFTLQFDNHFDESLDLTGFSIDILMEQGEGFDA